MKKYEKPLVFKVITKTENARSFSDSYCFGGQSK